jgi:hypothetical protein
LIRCRLRPRDDGRFTALLYGGAWFGVSSEYGGVAVRVPCRSPLWPFAMQSRLFSNIANLPRAAG